MTLQVRKLHFSWPYGVRLAISASVGLWVSGSHDLSVVSLNAISDCFIGCDIYICGRRTRLFAIREHVFLGSYI